MKNDTYKHGGNILELAAIAGRGPEDICDFSANINPVGPPEWLRSVISRNIDSVVHYPDPCCSLLIKAIAERYGICEDSIVAGNGSVEIIYALSKALGFSRAVIPVPCYMDYALAAKTAGLDVQKVSLNEADDFVLDLDLLAKYLKGDELIFLGQPNNPTGLVFDVAKFRLLARSYPDSVFVVDEAFIDFVGDCESLINDKIANVVVLRSLTKFYAIAGLRLGFAVAEPQISEKIRRFIVSWSVNCLAQAVGIAAMGDEQYSAKTREFMDAQRKWLNKELSQITGFHVYPGRANFLLVKINRQDFDVEILAKRLLTEDGIAIRLCDNFEGLDKRFFRVAVKTEQENRKLCVAIRRIMGERGKIRLRRKKAAIMFQGCSSSAGKSLLTAALCRVLLQDGVRVAPFKAQNMSLNSFVTRNGGEMGRAQVVQAQACRLEADVRMNPILLKPNSDTGSQVIILGKPVGNMNVMEYSDYKSGAFKVVKETYDSLAAEYDVIVLEGAGSPAEINIKQHDIVNMQMAQYADASVLLVGDIDRGGVFASFVGTMELLTQAERGLVSGFIVNRFRGDESLLGPALQYTYQHTGKPILGVVPFIKDVNIPEEDSVGFKNEGFRCDKPSDEAIEIVVVDLSHISNFTDFDALGIEPDVNLRKACRPGEIGSPDVLIIPGSKNIIADLEQLTKNGMAESIKTLAADNRTEIVGICAGFQILGKSIKDPHQIESTRSSAEGLGLLEVETVLAQEKTLKLTTAAHIRSSLKVKGYEIHHGQTRLGKTTTAVRRDDGEVIGVQNPDGTVWGTYLHGIFDCDEFRRWFIDAIRIKRGMQPVSKVCAKYDLEPAFDNLADIFRQSVRIDEVYRLIGL